MVLYLITPLFAFLSAYFFNKYRIKINKKDYTRFVYLLFSFAIPFIVFAFRSTNIGIDTKAYCEAFQNIANKSFIELIIYGQDDFEHGFIFLCKLLSFFSKDPRILLFATAVIINVLYALAIPKNSSMWFISSMIYFSLGNYLYNLNIMRQAIAAGFVLNAVICLVRKKRFLFVILVIVASTFHSIAIVTILFLFLNRFIKTKKQLIISLILIAVLTITSLEIVHIVVERFFVHYEYYFRHNYHSEQVFGLTSIAYVIIELFVLVLILKNRNMDDENRTIMTIYSVALVLAGTTLIMMPVFGMYERIAKFFQVFLILAVPYALEGIKSQNNQKFIQFGIVAYGLVYYIYIVATNAYLIVPFEFWNGI